MAARQDHEEIVSAARNDMAWFDKRQALERWIQNYVSPTTIIPTGQWCVVTKDKKGWKVEHGLADKDTPYLEHYADAHAPAPPVMEIRPPKPEPAPPRFNVPKAPRVNSHDWLASELTRLRDHVIEDLYVQQFPPLTMEQTGLTATMVAQMQRSADRLLRAAAEPMRVEMDHMADAARYLFTSRYATSALRMPNRFFAADFGGPDKTAIQEFKRPPPETSIRNK